MSKIRVMNELLANKIAAGEVVEKTYLVDFALPSPTLLTGEAASKEVAPLK